MEQKEFTKAMLKAGREPMLAKLRELFGPLTNFDTVATTYTDAELASVLWSFHCISKAAKS